jgi:hypothetical protein
MRTRLSVKWSISHKILTAFFIFLFSLVIWNKIYSYRWPEWIWHSFMVLSLIYAYPLAQFIYKDRTVVSYDQDNLYISNVVSGEEKVIPLEHVTFFKLTIRRDNYFHKWLLRYDDGFYQKQEIRFFYIYEYNYKAHKEFTAFIKKKNPAFILENYTW